MANIEITAFYADENGINYIVIGSENFKLRCQITTDAIDCCPYAEGETIEEKFEANRKVITKATVEKFAELQSKGHDYVGPLLIDSEWMNKYEVLASTYRADSNLRLGQSNPTYEKLLSERLSESSLWLALENAHQQFLKDGSMPPAQLQRDWTEMRKNTNLRFEEFLAVLSKS